MLFNDLVFNNQKETVDFLKLFATKKSNTGKLRNLNGFSIYMGYSYENTNDKDEPFLEKRIRFQDVDNNYLLYSATDNYFTPNQFISKYGSKRNYESLLWLNALFIDIDGIKNITDPQMAVNILYNTCQKAGIKKPNMIIHTSTNPYVHLQAYWLLDSIYVNGDKKQKYINWWVDSASAIAQSLKKHNKDFKIDFGASKNPVGYMRLPGSVNQKTGEEVQILNLNIKNERYTLSDPWLADLRKKVSKGKTKVKKSSKIYHVRNEKFKFLNHPQIQYLLKGVPEGYRNLSQYALAKCCFADGFSIDEAIHTVLDQNYACHKPEKKSKVIDVVKRAYGLIGPEHDKVVYGIDHEKIANTVNEAFGTRFSPDPNLREMFKSTFRRYNSTHGRTKYISKNETICRVISLLLQFNRKGIIYLPKLEIVANMAGVKFNSIKKYWPEIIKIYNRSQENKTPVQSECKSPVVKVFYFSRELKSVAGGVGTVENPAGFPSSCGPCEQPGLFSLTSITGWSQVHKNGSFHAPFGLVTNTRDGPS